MIKYTPIQYYFFKELKNLSPKLDACSKFAKIFNFQIFLDDHKNFIFKDRGMKFTVLNHIIIQNNKVDSTALSSFKQLQNSTPKSGGIVKNIEVSAIFRWP